MVHACTYDARLVAVEAARHNPTNAVGGPSVNFVGGMFVWWRCGLTIEQRSMPPPIRTTRWPKHGKWPMLKEVFEDLEWPGGDVDVVMCQEQQRLAFSASGSSGDLTVRLPLFVRATHAVCRAAVFPAVVFAGNVCASSMATVQAQTAGQ
eukprot:scaffold291843_cov22-Tisochrysis_lutea.AAC.1